MELPWKELSGGFTLLRVAQEKYAKYQQAELEAIKMKAEYEVAMMNIKMHEIQTKLTMDLWEQSTQAQTSDRKDNDRLRQQRKREKDRELQTKQPTEEDMSSTQRQLDIANWVDSIDPSPPEETATATAPSEASGTSEGKPMSINYPAF